MSHELFEFFGLLGTGVGFMALFERVLQLVPLRLAGGALEPTPSADHPPDSESEA